MDPSPPFLASFFLVRTFPSEVITTNRPSFGDSNGFLDSLLSSLFYWISLLLAKSPFLPLRCFSTSVSLRASLQPLEGNGVSYTPFREFCLAAFGFKSFPFHSKLASRFSFN